MANNRLAIASCVTSEAERSSKLKKQSADISAPVHKVVDMGALAKLMKPASSEPEPLPQLVDIKVLAALWGLPATWLQHQVRSACADKIPHIRLGHYVRFNLASPELANWLERRRVNR